MTEIEKCPVAQVLQVCEKEKSAPTTYIMYNYRWIILVLFFLVSLSSAFQWPMYVIVGDVIEKYYETTLETVNLTATVFLLCYVICIYPAMLLLQKFGLRFAIILASVGPCIASFIKLFTVHTDRFWAVILAQVVVGVSQTYVTVLPATVAAAWFGANQVSTACGIASVAVQVALAVGCLVPSMMLEGVFKKDLVESKLMMLNIGIVVFACVTLLLVVLFFREDPPTSPSETRSKLKGTKINIPKAIKEVVRDLPFMLFWFAYSLQIGILYTLCFLINPTVLKYYPNNASDAGIMGILFLSFGVVGSAMFGIILDKYRRFKETTVIVNVLSCVSIIAFSITLTMGIPFVYIFQTMISFFMTASVSVGLEVGAEITYPLPENISSGLLLIGTKIFGFALTTGFTSLFSHNYGVWTQFGMSCIVVFSTVLTMFVPFDLKRQAIYFTSKKDTNC